MAPRAKGQITNQLPPGVELIEHGVEIHVYRVTEDRLDALAASTSDATMDTGLCTLFAGVFAALLIADLTTFPTNTITAMFFVGATLVFGVAALMYVVRMTRSLRAQREVLNQIKRSRATA